MSTVPGGIPTERKSSITMKFTITRTRALGAVAGLGVVLALAGCSSNPSASSTTTTSAHATGGSSSHGGTTTSLTPSSTPVTTTPPATTIPYNPALNARPDVELTSCQAALGSWVAQGVVKNSAKAARTYQIVIDFVTKAGDTVLDTQIVTTPSVQPGASTTWKATGAAGQTNVNCVIRQVQAPAP